ncbi:MAG TPA: HlyD family efflux transporter periplasmic adaptor subunit [Pirellulaceae bacterium]|nr:HlyD family efflux transporter periplasmic adaptor subunit [Pirellulaceae bacterium]
MRDIVAVQNDIRQSSQLPALKLVQSSRRIRSFARILLFGLVLAVVGLVFVPWQQTARCSGRVIAFVPQERQQAVSSPIRGIVSMVAPGLREGDFVRKDEVILELQPTAANLADQIRNQMRDLEAKLEAIQVKIEVYGQNVRDFSEARDFAVRAVQEMVEAATANLKSKQQLVPAYEAKEWQARLNYERQLNLARDGAAAEKEVEKMKRDWDVAKSELESILLEVEAAQYEVEAKRLELDQKRSEMNTKVDNARAYQQGAISEQATVNKEIRELEIKMSELQQLVIRAPRDGTIYRLPVFERGQTVREGEPLFTIVPETKELAVELWVNGLDIPLVQVGDHVRLQFEGWPAIPPGGWPAVALGTFGGQVVAIDDSDDGTGRFRIQVRPALDDDPWPEQHLRQGVRANGWVMLREVPLGYELWRQLNGFPPTRAVPPDEKPVDKPKIKLF